MKTITKKIVQKKNAKREFIEKFKTQVRDSNSIENLRISKIDASCYKIYNTTTKSPKNVQTLQKDSVEKISFFTHTRKGQGDCLQTERKVRAGSNNDCFLLKNANLLVQQDNGWSTKSKYLEQVLKRSLEEFYRSIRAKVNEVQNVGGFSFENRAEIDRLQGLNNFVSIVDCIFRNVSKLKSECGLHVEAHSINLILKSLIQKVGNNHQFYNMGRQTCTQYCDRLNTEVDEANAGIGQEMHSVSSFKIENEKIHQQQFLDACLSNNNSKLQLKISTRGDQHIKQQCEDVEQSFFLKQSNPVSRYSTEIKRQNYPKIESSKISKLKLKSTKLKQQEQVVCQLLPCNDIQQQAYMEDSESKRRVLNDVIVMLNTKYNRCVKFQ